MDLESEHEHVMMPKKSKNAVKRTNGTAEEEETVPSKRAAEVECPLTFHSPAELFASLIAPLSPEQFFSEYWEQKPVHLRRDEPGVAQYYWSLFSLSDLPDLCSHDLEFYRDVNVVRCINGKKKVLNKTGKVKYPALHKLITQNKATVQFHQPQRFKDELWRVQERLESFFGALVGSNVYMTPEDSQGLPAHYDDVEVFILQLEGQKHWRLYTPTVPLASDYSLVPEDQLGSPTHDILLQEGDLLYFPRGTIHQANTLPGHHSTHLTLSTYQNMSWSDLLLDVLPGFLSESSRTDTHLRQGMPSRVLLGGCDNAGLRNQMAARLRHLADRIETGTGEMCSASLKRDFIMNRLPPHCPEEQLNPVGRLPQLHDTVSLTFREHVLLTVEPKHRTTDESPEMAVFVLHSLRNQRSHHMMSQGPQESEGPEDEEGLHVSAGLQFPLSHLGALQQLQKEEQLPVTDLLLPGPEEQLSLVVALWSESLLKAL
ncbi:ribosomal oxygenase 2 isoform X2 [Boleophthalmus pectinirostris]|uniref:ribosomal oxygenase 2 isoform X2 n=1 Tax=Boleophthalmus pectinirostris TaxID=150288 RepID=UPI00242BE473|nr:ribosomal oxygenase 2 isoform X2 [Boleophthalmus pectinirostris]